MALLLDNPGDNVRPTRTTRKLVMLTATGLTLAGTNQLAVQAKDTKPETRERETNPRRTEDTRPPTVTTAEVRDDHEGETDDENDDDHQTVTTSSVVATTAAPTTTVTTAGPTTRPTTTTAAPTTTLKPPTPTTTAVKPPTPTTTTAKPTTTTTAQTTTTTTAKPAPTIRASQAFLATKIGKAIQVDTTVFNDGTGSASVSVVITLSSTGALPNYEACRKLPRPNTTPF